ncbi:DUF7716 domain-containing protein [Dyella sp.]|uniref:DUF7716 domain-containing protein n=1 Tax=Dyella sp. TaxID=1869338 RepID=UPI002ED3C6EF
MPELLSLRQTIEAIVACGDDGDVWDRYAWVYADGDGALSSRFYLSSGDEEEDLLVDEDGEGLPPFAAEHALTHYLEAATFADVLIVQKRQRPMSSLDDYAVALDFYVHRDAFLDLGEASEIDVDNALRAGISTGMFTEYDLVLTACPPAKVGEAARTAVDLFGLSIADALSLCRQLPLSLGRRVNLRDCEKIERRFAAMGLPLQKTEYRALPWA